jgi:hypothetical protein
MQENQNAFQNAGSNGYSYFVNIGNQTSTFFVLILAFVMLIALLKSEERYRKLVESVYLAAKER